MKIKLFDKDLPQPQYQTAGSVAFDLYARQEVIIAAHSIGKAPLNVAVELPPQHWALLAPRSSLHKKGVMLANGIGVGDQDFCGDQDEYQAALLNFTDQEVTISRGERIVQMIIVPYTKVNLEFVDQLDNQNRGGFGSTG